MTGINGKNNKTKKNIVLFDKSISLEEINSIRNNKNSLIIATDFESFTILKENKIEQVPYDEFLTTDELCFYFVESQEFILGDVNGDLMLNVVDVVMLVDIILNNNSNNLSVDINQDCLINVTDIILLIDMILND